MEEDIKILEKEIAFLKTAYDISCKKCWKENCLNCAMIVVHKEKTPKIIQYTENLLKRYKELEKGCKTCVIRNDLNDYVENSIPISVIQNKKDELEGQRDKVKNIDEYDRCIGKIEVLQELLEER